MIRPLIAARWVVAWTWHHWLWCLLWTLAAVSCWRAHLVSPMIFLTLGFLPASVGFVWQICSPDGYERSCAGPWRRAGWRWHVRRQWEEIAEHCGLTVREKVCDGPTGPAHRIVVPKLERVHAAGHLLELTLHARPGQTVEELEESAPRLASTLGAVSYRTRPVTGDASASICVTELIMVDALSTAAAAQAPSPVARFESVRLGRTQGGGDWRLQLHGRHTLVAGCSGAGKGSVLWGICCGLAPAVRADIVRLWGIDLKRGVELEMGSGLFSARAYTPEAALDVLWALMRVIDQRGAEMAGATRLHEPTAGVPLHVLVIDELAALTAYADVGIRREADRLLGEILTQGRALGVVVVACVQDPRKDVVSMRGLFTQTIALRLRSSEETVMVLGDGMTRVAPAHRISPSAPGLAWVVDDSGVVDRVRADYWPDGLIRAVASQYATGVHVDVAPHAAEELERSMRAPRGRSRRSTVGRVAAPDLVKEDRS